jgi:hypothetical protein
VSAFHQLCSPVRGLLHKRVNANALCPSVDLLSFSRQAEAVRVDATSDQRCIADSQGAVAQVTDLLDSVSDFSVRAPRWMRWISDPGALCKIGADCVNLAGARAMSIDFGLDIVESARLTAANAVQAHETAAMALAVMMKAGKHGGADSMAALCIDARNGSLFSVGAESAGTHCQPGAGSGAEFVAIAATGSDAVANGIDTENPQKYYKLVQMSSTFSEALAIGVSTPSKAIDAMVALSVSSAQCLTAAKALEPMVMQHKAMRQALIAQLSLESHAFETRAAEDLLRQGGFFATEATLAAAKRKHAVALAPEFLLADTIAALPRQSQQFEALPGTRRCCSMLSRMRGEAGSVAASQTPLSLMTDPVTRQSFIVATSSGVCIANPEPTVAPVLGLFGRTTRAAPPVAAILRGCAEALAGVHLASIVGVSAGLYAAAACPQATTAALGAYVAGSGFPSPAAEKRDNDAVTAAAQASLGVVALSPALFGSAVAACTDATGGHVGGIACSFTPPKLSLAARLDTVQCPSLLAAVSIWLGSEPALTSVIAASMNRPSAPATPDETAEQLACDVASTASVAMIESFKSRRHNLGQCLDASTRGADVRGQQLVVVTGKSCGHSGAQRSLCHTVVTTAPGVSQDGMNRVCGRALAEALPTASEQMQSSIVSLVFTNAPQDGEGAKQVCFIDTAATSTEDAGVFQPLGAAKLAAFAAEVWPSTNSLGACMARVQTASSHVSDAAQIVRAASALAALGMCAAQAAAPADFASLTATVGASCGKRNASALQPQALASLNVGVPMDRFQAGTVYNDDAGKPTADTISFLSGGDEPEITANFRLLGVVQRNIDVDARSQYSAKKSTAPELVNVTVKGTTRTHNIWGSLATPGKRLYLVATIVRNKQMIVPLATFKQCRTRSHYAEEINKIKNDSVFYSAAPNENKFEGDKGYFISGAYFVGTVEQPPEQGMRQPGPRELENVNSYTSLPLVDIQLNIQPMPFAHKDLMRAGP